MQIKSISDALHRIILTDQKVSESGSTCSVVRAVNVVGTQHLAQRMS